MSSDPFADFAQQAIVAPRKRKLRAAEERAERERLEERTKLFRLWQEWHREQADKLLAGEHVVAARELIDFLKNLTLASGPCLVELVRRGPWCAADPDTRYQVLRLIDGALAQLRESYRMPPFDDALEGEPPTVFQIVREMLQ
jgi:hypothetical protein